MIPANCAAHLIGNKNKFENSTSLLPLLRLCFTNDMTWLPLILRLKMKINCFISQFELLVSVGVVVLPPPHTLTYQPPPALPVCRANSGHHRPGSTVSPQSLWLTMNLSQVRTTSPPPPPLRLESSAWCRGTLSHLGTGTGWLSWDDRQPGERVPLPLWYHCGTTQTRPTPPPVCQSVRSWISPSLSLLSSSGWVVTGLL